MDLATMALVAFGGKGIADFISARQQSKAIEKEGDILESEAFANSKLALDENRRFRARQKLAFLKNGVSLEGSPLLVLRDSEQEGKSQANSILNRGIAQKDLAKKNARAVRNQGRAALVGGFAQGGLASSQIGGPSSGIPTSTSLRSFFNL